MEDILPLFSIMAPFLAIASVVGSIMVYREMAKCARLSADHVPGASPKDIQEMGRASKIALFLMLGCTVLSIWCYCLIPERPRINDPVVIGRSAGTCVWAIVGLVLSTIFHAKIARIRKRCLGRPPAPQAPPGTSPPLAPNRRKPTVRIAPPQAPPGTSPPSAPSPR
jgi:hypothetical protein